MTLEELKHYNGEDGQKAYIAYKGKVYDVTSSPLWKNGIHQKMHKAGNDLTDLLKNAPHGEEVFARFPIIDTLDVKMEEKFDWVAWYRKYHPHPMLIHFPIALHIFAAGADMLFLLHSTASFAEAVFYTFFVATVMGAIAMIPGILSWWINYHLALTQIFVIKLLFSTITLLLGIVAIFIYLENPDIVYSAELKGILYHSIVLVTGVTVIILGYYGGKITWPDKGSS